MGLSPNIDKLFAKNSEESFYGTKKLFKKHVEKPIKQRFKKNKKENVINS